jgi:hypothetical protein
MSSITPQQALNTLKTYFSTGELTSLAFTLNIPYEDLGGTGRAGKALAMVQYAQRHGLYDQLVYQIATSRPQIDWDIPEPSLPDTPDSSTAVKGQSGTGGTVVNIHGNMVGGVIGSGKVWAENIAGGDINIGQPPQNKQEFQEQLAELEVLLKQARANSEFPSSRDAQTAIEDIADVKEEVNTTEPRSSRISRRLEDIAEILSDAGKVAQAAGNAGAAVLKTAPIIAGLIKAASVIF